ncbi:MAG TPA: beta-N-acetylhexosaminidase [Steroidobacteraceae bacterium]|nr:beta-N-acetylhexosaminidase [Steroidobacteraceae bacterium]
MNNIAPQLTLWLLLSVSALLASCGGETPPATPSTAPAPLSIIPIPQEVVPAAGQFVFNADTTVSFASDAEDEARYFIDLVSMTRGWSLEASDANDAGVRFELRANANPAPESYSLKVSPQQIVISASDARGLLYGGVTLWQLLTSESASEVAIPAMTINDAPRFAWRGVMLDSARHLQSPAFIRKFIDAMVVHKLNVLHWHLTDDQAWRLEIRKYPKLTEVGAWRVPAGQAPAANIDPDTQRPRVYGGFYSQNEVRDIVAYAAERHITIVPEIEMPGHASAPIAAYPQLGVEGHGVKSVPADWGVYPNIYNVDDATFAFLEDVLTEVMELFPSEYIHIGGDEAVKTQWQTSKAVQAKMKALGIPDEHHLQSYFVQRIGKFLSSKQRRLIGWDEILEGGLAPNATVMSWRGIDGAIAAATAGHDTVLSPGPTLYFDNRPYATPVPGRARVVSLEEVYRFDPAPAQLTPEQRKHVLGLQANIWTEHIRGGDRVEYMAFPRLAALSEVAWSASNRLDWQDFERRMPVQLERYRGMNLKFAEPPSDSRGGPQIRFASHDLDLCSENIAISLEDDAPIDGRRPSFLVDIMNACWILRGAELKEPTQLKVAVGQVPFNFQIGDDIKKVTMRKPKSAAGELEVRAGCDGELIASLSLAPATNRFDVTALPLVTLPAKAEPQDLCFQFTQSKIDPTWVLDSVELVTGKPRSP